MSRARTAAVVVALACATAACESTWKQENQLALRWLGYAEKPPRSDRVGGNEKHVAELEARCREDDLPSCAEAGQILLFGTGIARDAARAKPMLLQVCQATFTSKRADPRACSMLGAALVWGTGNLAPDVPVGVRLLAERCGGNHGQAFGCAYYGLALETGTGVERNVTEAIRAYGRACEVRESYAAAARGMPVRSGEPSREPLACVRLAKLAEDGVLGDPPEVVANLYADVCLGMSYSPEDLEYRTIACPRAAALYFEHEYTFHPPRGGGGGGIDMRGVAVGADAMDMAEQGCILGEPQSCEMMKRVYDLWEGRGDFLDTRAE